MKRYKPLTKWSEELRLSDLMKNAGLSDITKFYKKRRSNLLGAESKVAKLLDCEIDETANYITFVWLTEVTPDKELYGENPEYKEVDIEGDKRLSGNRSKTYELKIRILDFFDWLDTYPDKSIITNRDIKDIFDVSNIQVSSNDPSWQYQGFNYQMSSVFFGSIYPTDIPDPIWSKKHKGNGLLSKHLQGLINGIKFWYSPMASMLTKRLKKRKLI